MISSPFLWGRDLGRDFQFLSLFPSIADREKGKTTARLSWKVPAKEIQNLCRRVRVWPVQESTLNVLLTYSAPPERASAAEVAADHQTLLQEPTLQRLLESLPEPAMILNQQRQVVLANQKLAALLDAEPEELLGSRPGEILNCIHSREGAGGCGTSKFCAQCGVARTILETQTSSTTRARECSITCAREQGPAPLDLQVWATPLAASERFTVLAVRQKSSSITSIAAHTG